MSDDILGQLLSAIQGSLPPDPPGTVVAIPARDEEEQVGRCLTALLEQNGGDLFAIVLLVNNSTDATAALARTMAENLNGRLVVREIDLPGALAHAGVARRLAMDLAALWLHEASAESKVILTTDADSWVAPNWISGNLAALRTGADAIAGVVSLFPEDEALLTPQLPERGGMEWHYEALLVEIDSLLDPVAHDPWPRHDTVSGASLAVTLEAYRAVGGLPAVPLGEDRAFGAALVRGGWRLRHDPLVRVVTSGRLIGRAVGGAADTIRLRNQDPLAACDRRLEPVAIAVRRARCHRNIRMLYAGQSTRSLVKVASVLSVPQDLVVAALLEPNEARCWQRLEPIIPGLVRQTLYPDDLQDQLLAGQAILAALHAGLSIDQALRVESKPDIVQLDQELVDVEDLSMAS